jgi:hypothetical protein
MNMKSGFQKFTLLAHITFSVGWFGVVVPYLALAIAALTSRDEQIVRAACLSMRLIGWFVIVPFSLAALVSGLVQSLSTRWGLFRHWWIVAKLILTVVAVVILFQHMRDVNRVSLMAKEGMLSSADLRPELIHSAGGLLVLFVVMTLSMFKPWGVTPYGRRVSQPDPVSRPTNNAMPNHKSVIAAIKSQWPRVLGYHAIGLLVLFAVVHVAMLHFAGLHHH